MTEPWSHTSLSGRATMRQSPEEYCSPASYWSLQLQNLIQITLKLQEPSRWRTLMIWNTRSSKWSLHKEINYAAQSRAATIRYQLKPKAHYLHLWEWDLWGGLSKTNKNDESDRWDAILPSHLSTIWNLTTPKKKIIIKPYTSINKL